MPPQSLPACIRCTIGHIPIPCLSSPISSFPCAHLVIMKNPATIAKMVRKTFPHSSYAGILQSLPCTQSLIAVPASTIIDTAHRSSTPMIKSHQPTSILNIFNPLPHDCPVAVLRSPQVQCFSNIYILTFLGMYLHHLFILVPK